MKIRRLPDEVVSRIAAGEVIERPASVLKELLENSLDAGASKISIDSEAAGKKLLRITDDGSGMEPEDCRPALERHATSKISALEDLDHLSTFGFRGEALFSIAAVSRLRLTTCSRDSKRGWTIDAAGGKVGSEHEAAPVAGTTVEVRDLFYNMPARLKFLKSDASEKGHLVRAIEEAALAHPEASFVYKSEGRAAIQFLSKQDPRLDRSFLDRASEVLGEDLADGLLTLVEEKNGLHLRSLLAPAQHLSPSRNFQFFFVNRRPVTSRILQQALYRAYEPFRPKDRHPVAVVFLELPPDRFDVNVHPAKREVRFRSDHDVYEALVGAFSSALLRSKGIPTITPMLRSRTAAPYPAGRPTAPWKVADQSSAAPVAEQPAGQLLSPTNMGETELGLTSETISGGVHRPANAPRWFTPPFRYLGQIEQAYLVFDAGGGLLVVDQHAAQERILFERYLAELESGSVSSQPLILPLEVELPASQVQHIVAREESLHRAGFGVRAFGRTTLQVTEAPSLLQRAGDIKEVAHRLLESLQSESSAAADVKKHAIATIACKAAVKAHDRLGSQEALRLLEDLKDCKDGTCCPHGRPSMISLGRDELARRFKRPGAPPL